MAAYPDGIDYENARGAEPASRLRRLLPLLFLGAVLLLAFTGLLGGMANTTFRAQGDKGVLVANVPEVLRNGMFFEMRFELIARRPVEDATLVIDRSYLSDVTVNTSIPQADQETAEKDAFRFSYGPLKPGDRLDVKFDGQINPSLVVGTQGTATFADGDERIASLPLELRVLP